MATRAALFALAWATTAMASQPVTVLELYTSQGCSSCPGADAAFQALADRADLPAGTIPLVYHVDYWNHLGWPDPYSQARWSARQRRYSGFLGERRIYTPQLVVNGRRHRVGPRDPMVLDQIAAEVHAEAPGELSVQVRRKDRRLRARARLKLTAPVTEGRPQVRLVLYQNAPATAVRAGENSGRRLVNAWVARAMVAGESLGPRTTGEVVTDHVFELDPAWGTEGFGVVALLEDQADGRLLHGARAAAD